MGIRFCCHHCNHALHVKDFQAGKRGRCPACQGPFRIPLRDADVSLAIGETATDELGDAKPQFGLLTATRKRRSSSHGSVNSDAGTGTRIASDEHAHDDRNPLYPPGIAPRDLRIHTMPEVFAKVLDARWYVRPPSGGQYGPAPSRLLMDWIGERRVTADSLLWCDGMAQWQLAGSLVPELFEESPSGSSTQAPMLISTPGFHAPTQPVARAEPIPATTFDRSLEPGLAHARVESVDAFLSLSPLDISAIDSTDPNGNANQVALMIRRRRERKRQWMIVCTLGIVSILLLATLAIVLVMQIKK